MRVLAALCCGLFLIALVFGQSYKPKEGYVPDSVTAARIAEAVLTPVYGERQIISERPFTATLKNEVWTVQGTLHCPDGRGGTSANCNGGVAEVEISKSDARILGMRHGK